MKTAYEMRISDWSSDVCSADLQAVEDALDTVTGAELRPHLALRDCESKQAGRGAASDHGPAGEVAPGAQPLCRGDQLRVRFAEHLATRDAADLAEDEGAAGCVQPLGDRKSVVSGKRGAVRLDLGGPRNSKKKNTKYKHKQ